MKHLTLDLSQDMVDVLDWLVRGDDDYEPDDFSRRQTINELMLGRARQLREDAHDAAGAGRANRPQRDELETLRRERDALRKALEAERATRRRDRERNAVVLAQVRTARSAVARLSDSRAAYRDLALRIEAALLDAPPRSDFRGIETRLRQKLSAAGFTMPAAHDS